MHERSLVGALVRQVHRLQTEQGAARVLSICVSIGEFSGVEPELFCSAFEELIDGSPLRGAQLELRETPLEARCEACANEFLVVKFQFLCPHCGSSQVNVLRGEGLVLESVTLE
ncbi:MAG: hypothetical protein GTO03_11800 [Planctomycetales bacterium]|nr:hypothetical protein [Planctomycetales bacterium]